MSCAMCEAITMLENDGYLEKGHHKFTNHEHDNEGILV